MIENITHSGIDDNNFEKEFDDIVNNTLTPREKTVLYMFYGLQKYNQNYTKAEIGEEFKVTRTHVDSILSKGIYKLKKFECFGDLKKLSQVVAYNQKSGYYRLFKKLGFYRDTHLNRSDEIIEEACDSVKYPSLICDNSISAAKLGNILCVNFNQYCETKKMFNLYNGYPSGVVYDTLMLKSAHVFRYRNDSFYISFYVKRQPLGDQSKEITTSMTATDLKNNFSSGRTTRLLVDKDLKIKCFGREPLRIAICDALPEMDINGDSFFKTAVSFNALNKTGSDSPAVVNKYYIVGFNFRGNINY